MDRRGFLKRVGQGVAGLVAAKVGIDVTGDDEEAPVPLEGLEPAYMQGVRPRDFYAHGTCVVLDENGQYIWWSP